MGEAHVRTVVPSTQDYLIAGTDGGRNPPGLRPGDHHPTAVNRKVKLLANMR